MLSNRQTLDANNDIQVPNSHVIVNQTLPSINDTTANFYTLADPVTKKGAVNGSLEKGRQQSDVCQRD